MKRAAGQTGFRDGQAPKRRQKDTPSRRAREARRLRERIERTTAERHDAWAEGDLPFRTERLTTDLDRLHADKRVMRRDIYREVPELEGHPVFKGQPRGAR